MKNISWNNKNVLIVDSNYTNRLYLKLALEQKKAHVFTVSFGWDAVRILNSNIDIEIVIIDIHTKISSGGKKLVEILKLRKSIVCKYCSIEVVDKKLICKENNSNLINPIHIADLNDKISYGLFGANIKSDKKTNLVIC